jgi:hypothetical protein
MRQGTYAPHESSHTLHERMYWHTLLLSMQLMHAGIVLLGWVVCIAAELVVARACSPSGRGGHGNRDQTQTHWRAKYSALASKDSGPDLAAGIATLREARAAVCGTASGSNTV